MNNASKFVDLNTDHVMVAVIFDGADHKLPHGQNLAAALMSAGITVIRNTPVSHSPRSPYCMMGACYDCLVEIDGSTQQACMTQVREGLVINRVKYLDQQVDE